MCHSDRYQEWISGPHSKAYSDPIFQESWLAQGLTKYCLACHTTGFDPNTGEYALEGVTCEQCHSPYVNEHPPARIFVDHSEAICRTCHTVTYDEWSNSTHGQVGTDCLSCHEVHTQEMHGDNELTVCANCHIMMAESYAHTTHQNAGLTCLTCHMQLGEDDIGAEGKVRTAHDFKVKPKACVECHAPAIHGGDEMISLRAEVKELEQIDPIGLEQEVDALHEQVNDLEKVGTGKLWSGVTIGALAGLVVGAIAAWVWRRQTL